MPVELLNKYYSKAKLLSANPYGDLYVANSRRTSMNVIVRVIQFKSIEPTVMKQLIDAYKQTKRIEHSNIYTYAAFYLDTNTIILEADSDQQTVIDDLAIRKDIDTPYTTDELFYFAYQIADALCYIHYRAAYENLLFSVRADSIIIKGSPLSLMDMKIRLSIFTAKWPMSPSSPSPGQSTSSESNNQLSIFDIFEFSTTSFEERVLNNVAALGHLLLEMALMKPLEKGTANSVCEESEEIIINSHNCALLGLIRFCLNSTQSRRNVLLDIKDFAVFGLGLRYADQEFRVYNFREKASTIDKLIKQLQMEKKLLSISRAQDIISKVLTIATTACNKGLALSYYSEDVNIVKDVVTIYPNASIDGHIYDLLRDMVKIIEPGIFTHELNKLINVEAAPSLHSAVVELKSLMKKMEADQPTDFTIKDVVVNELFSNTLEDGSSNGSGNTFAIIYSLCSAQDINLVEATDIISMLPQLIRKPILLTVFMRCCIEKSVYPKIPFRYGILQPTASRLIVMLMKNNYNLEIMKEHLDDLGQQCLAPICLLDRDGCKICCTHLTALMIASWNNKASAIRLLLAELGYFTENRTTALMFAAIAGSTESIPLLIIEAQHRNSLGQTALMLAAMRGHIGVARVLAPLEAGLQDSRGWTALMYAVQQDSLKMVQLLAEYESGYQDADGNTALMYAVHRSSMAYVEVLCKHETTKQAKENMTALLFAIQGNKLDIASLLLPMEVSLTTVTGETALMYAVTTRNEQFVHQIISSYPKVMLGQQDSRGLTALMKATQRGYDEIVRLLILHESGKQANDGTTALMIAVKNCCREIVDMLREKEKMITDINGNTALMHAAQMGNICATQSLKNCEAGFLNNDGYTALIIAIKHGHTDIANELLPLEHSIHSRFGLSAPLMARATQNQAILQLFVRCYERNSLLSDT